MTANGGIDMICNLMKPEMQQASTSVLNDTDLVLTCVANALPLPLILRGVLSLG